MAYITFDKVSRIYGEGERAVKALNKASFEIEKGELVVIVGPSGAGKTTLLNLLGGMDACTSGKITLGKKTVSAMKEKQLTDYRRRAVGFVFQFYNLMQNLTALENVELAIGLAGSSLKAKDVLASVGLADRMDNFPSQLSGGEQQRVSIARALAKDPDVILCDEPTGALDYTTGKQVLSILADTCRSGKKTVIIITHNTAITRIADRVIRVKNGAIESVTKQDEPESVERIEW